MTTTLTPTQDGYSTFGTFVEDTTLSVQNAGGPNDLVIGMTFDNLDTTLIYTAATLTLTFVAGSGTPGTLTLRYVTQIGAPDWSASNLPVSQSLPYDTIGTTLATSPPGTTISFTFDPNLIAGTIGDFDCTPTLLHRARGGAKWAFTIDSTSGNSVSYASSRHPTVQGPQLSLTTISDLTGRDGLIGNSRVDRCPVCGTISLREHWVKSGYLKRLVCSQCWDPADPLENQRPIRPEDRLGINAEG
jgi:hypothetical protein